MARILLLTLLHPLPENPARGAFVADRIRLLREMGHEVKVVNTLPRMLKIHEQRRSTMQGVAKAPRQFEFEEHPVLTVRYTAFPDHPFPSWTSASIKRQAKRVENWLGDWRPDLVSVHTLWPAAILAQKLASRYSSPCIATVHGHDIEVGLSANYSSRIIQLEKSVQQLVVVSDKLAVKMPNSVVIPCHVEVPEKLQRPIKKWRGRWRRGELEVLFPANSKRPEKDHYLALQTCRELETRGWRVKIGDLPNVPRNIVHDRMHVCDIALITSRRESGPLVAREAIVCGLPVVSVDIGDMKSWLPPHCIAKERTPEALADAVEAVLKSEETIQLPDIFEKEHVSKELEKLFTRLLKKS